MIYDKHRKVLALVKPSLQFLPEYATALGRGWSPDNVRPADAIREQLEKIRDDEAAFVALLDDPEARAGPVTLPDGSAVPRLPGYHRWLWDGEFCGSIGFRWQPGTSTLPAYVLGHIGFAVVPWKRGLGYAKQALALLLPDARERGLAWVELSTSLENIASQKVILANGGEVVGRFQKGPAYGGAEALRWRIPL